MSVSITKQESSAVKFDFTNPDGTHDVTYLQNPSDVEITSGTVEDLPVITIKYNQQTISIMVRDLTDINGVAPPNDGEETATILANEVFNAPASSGGVAPTWDTIEGKPAVVAAGETEEEARTAIGAGVGNSNLELGTTGTTALAGNTSIPPPLPAGGSTTTYLRGDNTWVIPTNTTYAAIPEVEFNAGVSGTVRAVSAISLNRDIEKKIGDRIVIITQAAYDALVTKNPTTIYLIVG